ncbi:MAG: penicillin-binding transpeptidase domain-containing protein [Acidimicrobiales bacterium]
MAAVVAGVAWFGPWHDRGGRPASSSSAPAAEPTAPAPSAEQVAEEYAAAWQAGDLSKVAFTATNAEVLPLIDLTVAGLTAAEHDHPAKVEITDVTDQPDAPIAGNTGPGVGDVAVGHATAKAHVTWRLDDTRTWDYDVDVALQRGSGRTDGDSWRVDWKPTSVEPSLEPGETLRTSRVAATRGDILGLEGQTLVGQREVVEVGIQPSRAADPAASAREVALILGADPEGLVQRVQAAPPDQFVSVVTLRREAYDAVRGRIQPLSGTVFRESDQSLAPSKDFARALLGTVGQATKEDVDGSQGKVKAGDVIGRSGLQAAQDEVLAGTPGLSVQAVAASPGTPRELKAFPAVGGRPVTVTLDPRVQLLADAVMATAPKPAALVAVRVSNGDVLAVANGPTGFSAYDRAMVGRYPPGSTFKVASALTLLQQGLTLDSPVDCPASITIGKVFTNAEGEVLGTVPFRKDFADSCNTAFVGLSRLTTAQQLHDTAALLGYRDLDLGVPVFGGSVPLTGDATEHAANMIGQGKVLASPFAVALASASVAAGRSVQPRLIVDPAAAPPAPGAELAVLAVTQLREAMRLVVTDGTGTAVRGVPGGDVAGKTGTAEFGTASPPRTHAWFTGFQGDVAFAVLVEDGGFGGSAAAPLAADFLTRLATG